MGAPFCGLCVNLFGRVLYNCRILGQFLVSQAPIDALLKLTDDQKACLLSKLQDDPVHQKLNDHAVRSFSFELAGQFQRQHSFAFREDSQALLRILNSRLSLHLFLRLLVPLLALRHNFSLLLNIIIISSTIYL